MNPRLPELLASRLAQPLKGPVVGSRFEPTPRFDRQYDQPPPDARKAAVLLLLYPYQGRWHLPLTLRPSHLPDHAGQISLPGGAIEPGETDREAAVREFYEELGADGHRIELLGRLSTLYVHASRFRIEPWVGLTWERPAMVPNPAEVAALLEVPLEHLVDPANFACHTRDYHGQSYTAPHFAWQEHNIWGATCMILGELMLLLEELDVEV
jgi:8-oxo-dGTP pyrophosphatase MutT (NUDIX family)